jgi:hypothetical protein
MLLQIEIFLKMLLNFDNKYRMKKIKFQKHLTHSNIYKE